MSTCVTNAAAATAVTIAIRVRNRSRMWNLASSCADSTSASCSSAKQTDITEVLQCVRAASFTVLLYEQRRDTSFRITLQQSELSDLRRLDLVSRPGHRRLLVVQLDQLVRRRVPVLGRRRSRHQHGLSPSAHAPGVQDLPLVRIFSRRVRNPDARRRSDFLGGHASRAPSALRSGTGSAYTPGQWLLGASWLDHLR